MRDFVMDFVLPLVEGGPVAVGRPLMGRAYGKLAARYTVAGTSSHALAVTEGASRGVGDADTAHLATVAAARRHIGVALLRKYRAPVFDEAALRLSVALHNLVALGHPAFASAVRTRENILGFSVDLASLPAPESAEAVVDRYTLLAGAARLQRNEHEVRDWLGTHTFVGREPPRRLLMWPKLRRVQVTHQERSWLRDVGIANDARRLWDALCDASPLLDALDATRLDPPISWPRLAAVLRFAPLARGVAARLVEQGLGRVGDPLALCLFGFAGAKPGPTPTGASVGASVAAGIQFLAHLFWLHTLCRTPGDVGPALSALLLQAQADPRLLYPPDVAAAAAPVVAAFTSRLTALRPRARTHLDEARATVAVAMTALPSLSPVPSQVPGASTL